MATTVKLRWDKCLSLVVAAVFVVLSGTLYISDSEIWSITLSGLDLLPTAKGNFDGIGQLSKLLHHVYLKFAYLWPFKDASLFIFARLMSAVIGLGIAILLTKILRLFRENLQSEYLIFILLIGTHLFLERGFRIRADLLASFFHLIAFYYFFKVWYRQKQLDKKRVFILVLIELLVIASTLKAAMLLVALHGFYFSCAFLSDDRRRLYKALGKKLLLQVSILGVALFAISLVRGGEYFESLARLLTSYAMESTQKQIAVPDYLSAKTFMYVFKFIKFNPVISFGIFAGLVVLASRLFRSGSWLNRPEEKALFFYFISALLMIFFYNDKVPFFLASFLPLFVLLAFLTLDGLLEKFKFEKKWRYQGLAALFVLKSFGFAGYFLAEKNNFDQLKIVGVLQRFYYGVGFKNYYDVIGVLPKEPPIMAYAGPNQLRNNKLSYQIVEEIEPEVIFYTDRMGYLKPEIGHLLQKKYRYLGGDVWVRSDLVQKYWPQRGAPRWAQQQSLKSLFAFDRFY